MGATSWTAACGATMGWGKLLKSEHLLVAGMKDDLWMLPYIQGMNR